MTEKYIDIVIDPDLADQISLQLINALTEAKIQLRIKNEQRRLRVTQRDVLSTVVMQLGISPAEFKFVSEQGTTLPYAQALLHIATVEQ